MFKAIWLDKNNEVSIRTYDERWTPARGEVLVQVQYSGINPADIKHGRFGFHESVAGYDYAGTIMQLGEGMDTKFKIGDRVCGFGAPLLNKPPQYGAHQDYHVARHFVHVVPQDIKLEDASTMPVIVHTAADALFNQMGLKLHGEEQKPILIWGGAGAVGSAAIQLAKAAGCSPIITTASSKNHEVLLSLGADKCFDYHDEDVAEKITTHMNGSKFPFVFDAVAAGGDANHPSSTHICESLGSLDAKFAAPLPVNAPTREWPRVFACRNTDFDFVLPNGSKIEHKANLLWQEKLDEAFVWALEHYENGFRMPNVKVVKGGEKGLEALKASAAGKATLGKSTIQHPL